MAKQLPERNALDVSSTWDLSALFVSNDAWEQAFAAVTEQIKSFPAFSGTLHQSPEVLLRVIESEYATSLELERLFVYARMRRDEDNAVALYQGMADRAMQLSAAFSTAAAFIAPEILQIPEDVFTAWVELPVLGPYRRVLKILARKRAHTLSAPEERLMALVSEPLESADSIFTMLNNADLRFGTLADDNGEEVELTHGNYRSFIDSADRCVREAAYHLLYAAFLSHKNTLAAAYAASVKTDVFGARARYYESAIQGALFGSDVPLSVYDGLIDAIESRLDILERYLALRQKALGVEQLHMYDLYTPIVPDVPKHMDYDEMKALVKHALAPLGQDYAALLDRAYSERWIDVHENRGKTSGAYSWGAYGAHPYVLLNFIPEADYAFTLAHELGHAMHTHYSDSALPYQDAQYKIMAAEVASTVNEVMLLKYMLQNESDPKRRAFLVNHYLEQFRTTVFRQTMFAAFERETHRMCEAGVPLTVESLCDVYGKLNEKYYPGVVVDEEIRIEWARIPHFYNAFYVYQYATGFCAAVKLAQNVLAGGEGLANYLAFLKSGGSDFPITLLKNAGVDLKKPESILTSLAEFDDSVRELSALLGY